MVQENKRFKKNKRKSPPKKYSCIVKIGNNPDKTAKVVKYRTSNLLNFTNFIERKFPTWTWFNVYLKASGQQINSFTKHRRPIGKDG